MRAALFIIMSLLLMGCHSKRKMTESASFLAASDTSFYKAIDYRLNEAILNWEARQLHRTLSADSVVTPQATIYGLKSEVLADSPAMSLVQHQESTGAAESTGKSEILHSDETESEEKTEPPDSPASWVLKAGLLLLELIALAIILRIVWRKIKESIVPRI